MAQIDRTEEFKAWVAKQDPEREYDYESNTDCAFAQFLRAAGVPFSSVLPTRWYDAEGKGHRICEAVAHALINYVPRQPNGGRTFGALAERLANIPARSGA